ncbi:DUF397 domain-containing protein [Streptomyces sp. 15-116A]|uniref:DUF397 domain-containing protein n=1 Tax=Streptomyces sp. 15-116A TaxID=2259035 RepID=UPI0021B1CFD7|nr:DUF397 domain-containing protein [Streptomyces sp. 15-116A]MCT7351337.1 DUF397 domain-containing protein [Streptomyces sp. 15-116A]
MPTDDQSVTEPTWFKSSHSGGNTTECVEAAYVPAGLLVRDSKQPGGGHLRMSATAWADFIGCLARGTLRP